MIDVLVVGAGPAGSTTATLLARAGIDVTLVDRSVFPRDKPCAEFLSPGAVGALADVGLDAALGTPGRYPLQGFVVYTPDGRGFRGEYGDRWGVAVSRVELDAALVREAEAAGAEVRQGVRATDVSYDGARRPVLTLRGAAGGTERAAARLVIAADGLGSALGRRLGLVRPMRRRRIGLVTHVEGIQGLGPYGEMHVGRGAYCGVAPITSRLANVAMVVDAAEAAPLRGRAEAYLEERLATFPRLAPRLAEARRTGPVLAVGPLAYRSRRASADGVLLAGDAAGFFDPLTGQGIYRAVRGAALAARVAAAALAEGDASARRLAQYDRLRREFRGQYAVERLVAAFAARPRLAGRTADRLARRPALADRLLGVTGDVRPPREVLHPAYLARLLW